MEILTGNTDFLDSLGGDFSRRPGTKLWVIDSAKSLAEVTLPRKNDAILSIICIEGQIDIRFDMKDVTIGSRSIMVLLPGHLIESFSTSDDFRGFMLMTLRNSFDAFLPMMSRLLICSLQFKDNPVIKLTDREIANQILFHDILMNKLGESDEIFTPVIVDKTCEAVFFETLNIYIRRMKFGMSASCKRSEALFYRFIVAIEENFTKERAVSFYADKLCVTSKHLSSIVKDISGRTAGEWIDTYVVNEIKRQLTMTDLTIQEISCRLNFANQSFLGKYFKSHTGLSPREFRARIYG